MSGRRIAILAPADRLGLSRTEAAAYTGLSTATFDILVRRGLMPAPKRAVESLVWDRRQLDVAFDRLPDGAETEKVPQSAWD